MKQRYWNIVRKHKEKEAFSSELVELASIWHGGPVKGGS